MPGKLGGHLVADDSKTCRKESLANGFYNISSKIMLLGDSCTGKTCLLVRFKDETFLKNNFISTVGIDFKNKIIDVEGIKIKLQIWDTAGQERFRSVTHAYYRDAHGILLVFDVTSSQSFENVRSWLSEIKEYASSDAIILLLGNKVDLTGERKVTTQQALKLAEDYGVTYVETSAKTGQNVNKAFLSVARELARRKIEPEGEKNGKLVLDKYDNRKKCQC